MISISLKSIDGYDFSEAMDKFTRIIKAEAMRHKDILTSGKLDKYETEQYMELLSPKYSKDTIEESLWIISNSLKKVFNRSVIVLIDEYDVPLDKAYEHGYYDRMANLIRNLFEKTLESNDNLHFAVLTGCLRIAKESIFTGLSNLKVQSITSVRFDGYFGFTDEEVRKMLDYYGFGEKYQAVRKWYDGYKFGDISVYCPWDVVNYVSDLLSEPDSHPRNYWVNSSSNDIIRTFLEKATDTTKDEMESLIEGKSVIKKISEDLTYAELDASIENLWSVLYTTGYLTKEKKEDSYSEDMLALKIPNEKIRVTFKEKILNWFQSYAGNNTVRYMKFTEAFIAGEPEVIKCMFDDYLGDMISIRDTASRSNLKENFYHGFLLGILNFRTDWIVKSNREGGLGYNDILIFHKKSRTGMIIEVEYAGNDNLDAECRKALEQIESRHYTDALKEYRPEKIYKYAVACCRKHSMVEMEKEDEARN